MTTEQRPVVLLVQPEHDDRDMYVEFLRHAGLTPLPASTAKEGLRLARHADIVVTGLMLAGPIDGIAFVAQLKRDKRAKRIPVIALTSRAWDGDRDRALGAGCDLFLAKPCLPHVLTRAILRLLPDGAPKPSIAPHAA
jgi:CheY-like chemotaxis protein